jgi:hypothetical protein
MQKNTPSYSPVVWSTKSISQVLLEAKAADKFILLVGGSKSCGNCNSFKNSTVNITKPPLQQFVNEFLYCWYVDVGKSQDWKKYVTLKGDIGLPILALIDPKNNRTLNITSGDQSANSMITWCQNVIGPNVYPKVLSLTPNQIVHQENLLVEGTVSPQLWADKVWFRLDGVGEFKIANGKTNWSIQIDGLSIGNHTLEVFVSYYTKLKSKIVVVPFVRQV